MSPHSPGRAILAIACLTLSACITVGPDYQRPDTVVADEWHQAVVANMESSDPSVAWWETLNDPKLNELVRRAQDGNLGLADAVARIEEALRFLGIARGERYPDVDAVGGFDRSKSQLSVLPNVDSVDEFSDLRVGATWELDLWGRVRRTVESSQATYEATVEAYRDVLVLLNARVASYLQQDAFDDVEIPYERIPYEVPDFPEKRKRSKGVPDDVQFQHTVPELF